MQNLGSIMSSKRVDNYWKEEPPTFLKRVGIYPKSRAPTPSYEITLNDTQENSTRKLRCLACTPHEKKNIIIPEERVPWEEPKKMLTRRLSALAIFPLTSTFNPSKEKTEVNLKDPKSSLKYKKKSLVVSGENFKFPTLEIANTKSTNFQEVKQKVVLQVGQSQITLNFPPFAEVKFVEGKCEKYLQRNSCGCKRLNSLRQNVLDSKIKSWSKLSSRIFDLILNIVAEALTSRILI